MQDPQQVESEREQQGQCFVHQERGQALQVVIGQAVAALEQLHLASGQAEAQTLAQVLHQPQRVGAHWAQERHHTGSDPDGVFVVPQQVRVEPADARHRFRARLADGLAADDHIHTDCEAAGQEQQDRVVDQNVHALVSRRRASGTAPMRRMYQ